MQEKLKEVFDELYHKRRIYMWVRFGRAALVIGIFIVLSVKSHH